jgi:release factor glutamine methyltransferase
MIEVSDITYSYTRQEKQLLCQYLNESLNKKEQSLIDDAKKNWINQLNQGMPYQYIIGEAAFYGLEIMVNQHVLIPRPETEELVEIAISYAPQRVMDLGTGSGCIALAIKNKLKSSEVMGLDLSKEAIDLAKNNAKKLQLEVEFVHDNMLEPSGEYPQFDLIISNPPYVGEGQALEESVMGYEPHMALFSPGDVLKFYKSLKSWFNTHLKAGGMMLAEINQDLAKETLDVFIEYDAKVIKDFSDNDRFLIVKK